MVAEFWVSPVFCVLDIIDGVIGKFLMVNY